MRCDSVKTCCMLLVSYGVIQRVLDLAYVPMTQPWAASRAFFERLDQHSSCIQAEDEYMISDYDLFVNKFISVPKDMGQLNCAAFVAGIVKGALEGAGFPAR